MTFCISEAPVKALIIQHDHVSPSGPVGERFIHHGFELDERVVVSEEFFRTPNVDFEFPDFADYDVIIPMGAPWGAWDDECIGAWLQPELAWVKAAVESGTPVLGICFGGQLIARAMGGSVTRAPHNEIGWANVWSDRPELVSEGPWFQFHYDRWEMPAEGVEIARNPYAPQAFLINNALALQFHPEVTAASLKGWLDWGGDTQVEKDGQDGAVMLGQTAAYEAAARQRTFDLIDAFLRDVAKLID